MLTPRPALEPPEVSREAVEAELRPGRWRLGFAPAVEARFEADTGAARRRELLTAGGLALLVYDLFLVNDLLTRPEVLDVALRWRAVTTVWGLGVLAWIAWGRVLPRWREGLMASTVVVAIVCSACIALATGTSARIYDPFCFSLVMMAGNIAFPLRFSAALAASLLSLGVSLATVLHPDMPDTAQTYALGLLLGTVAFTLLACRRMEGTTRRAYLLQLRETLRTQAAHQAARDYAVLSMTDALTGLPNRRALDAELAARLKGTAGAPDSTDTPGAAARGAMALVMIDVDHFKLYNDSFGHPAGDACLQRVARRLREHLRPGDFVARAGGEEFVALLDDVTPEQAAQAAERLRAGVELEAVPGAPGASAPVVTVSLGLALAEPQAPVQAHALLAAADAALYRAKRLGRNGWQWAPAWAGCSPGAPEDGPATP